MKITKKIQASSDISLDSKYVFRIWKGKLRIGEITYREENPDVDVYAKVAVTWDDGSATTTNAKFLRYITPAADMAKIRELQMLFNEYGMDISNEVKLYDYYLEQTGDVDLADQLSDEAAHYGRQLTSQSWQNVRAASSSQSIQYGSFLIAMDLGGDGYNIYKDGELWDEGYGSIQKAMQAIDESGEGGADILSSQYAYPSDNWIQRDNTDFFEAQNTQGKSHPDVGKPAKIVKQGDELYGKRYTVLKVVDDIYTLALGGTTTATYRREDLTLNVGTISASSRPAGPYIVWVKIRGESEWRMFKSSYEPDVDPDFLDRVSEQNGEDYEDVIVLPQGQDANDGVNSLEDEGMLPTSQQEFTSERTSINSTKLPAIYKLINIPSGSVAIDYGGGKFDNAVEYMRDLGVTLYVYDPYNRTDEHNREVIKAVRKNGGADYAICSNVLNVIKEPSIRTEVLKNIKTLLKSTGKLYLTVYEGRGDGAEGETKSGYQLNKPTAGYLEEIREIFPDAVRKGKLITATPNGAPVQSSTSVYSATLTANQAELIQQVTDKVLEVMQGPEGGFDLEDAKYYSRVSGRMENGAFVVEVRCECDYEFMMNMAQELNDIIQQVDHDAYFDMEQPGIMSAYLYQDVITSAQRWEDIPEPALDPPEYPDDRYDMEETLEFEFDLTLIVDDTGYYEFTDKSKEDFIGDGNNGGWMGHEYFGHLVSDPETLQEQLDELIRHMIPGKAGTYRITGTANLVYRIEGVTPETDDEAFFDSGEVSFDFTASSVEGFTWEEIASESIESATQLTRTHTEELNYGYHCAQYSNGARQIDKARPYDDADYFYALFDKGSWNICKNGRVLKSISEMDIDDLNDIVDELEMLNSTISPRMMYN